MRILFISDRLPDKLHDGGNLRTFHILRGLAREHDVSVLSHDDTASAVNLLRQQCGISKISVVRRQTNGSRIVDGLASGRLWRYPLFAVKNRSSSLLHEADQLLSSGQYDAVHFNHLDVACLALERSWSQFLVFDTHNCLSAMVRDMTVGANPKRPRWLYRREADLLLNLESAVCRRMDLILTCSQEDATAFASMIGVGDDRLLVAPNGVDLDYYQPSTSDNTEPGAIVFVGLMSYMPNEDAAFYLCREVLPRLADHVPRPRVYLVGRNPSTRLSALHDGENVIVTGEVADVRPYVAKAQIVAVPLRFGGGTRLKILEAFAMGKAVVSTSKGAEGIPARPGQEILIADTAEELEKQIRSALGSNTLRARLGESARRFVVDHFGWERIQSVVAKGYGGLSRTDCVQGLTLTVNHSE